MAIGTEGLLHVLHLKQDEQWLIVSEGLRVQVNLGEYNINVVLGSGQCSSRHQHPKSHTGGSMLVVNIRPLLIG